MLIAAALELVSTIFVFVWINIQIIKFLSLFMEPENAVKTLVTTYALLVVLISCTAGSLATSFIIEAENPAYWHGVVVNMDLSRACQHGPMWHYVFLLPAFIIDIIVTFVINLPHLFNGAFLIWYLIGIVLFIGTAGNIWKDKSQLVNC